MSKVIFKVLFAMLIGLLVWAVYEPFFPARMEDPSWAMKAQLFISTLGCLVGGYLGYVNGFERGGKQDAIKTGLLGLLFGLVGSVIGNAIGGILYQAFEGQFILFAMIGRALAIGSIGTMIGFGIGLAGRTKRQMIIGTLGGMAGGLLSGIIFDPISATFASAIMQAKGVTASMSGGAEIGIIGRALTAILLPGFIAAAMALFAKLIRTAWVRLILGRNEGREWVIDRDVTMIGRDERAQITLFGDQSVAPFHAAIQKQGEAFYLQDNGSPAGTIVNQSVVNGSVLLTDGAVIQVGSHRLHFLLRAGSAPARAAEALRSHAAFPLAGQALQYPVSPTQTPAPMPSPPVAVVGFPRSLRLLNGPYAGGTFLLDRNLDLGREAGDGILLNYDSTASRRHATIAISQGGGVVLTDLGSSNGTFVNGNRIQSATIQVGDTVRIGNTEFVVE